MLKNNFSKILVFASILTSGTAFAQNSKTLARQVLTLVGRSELDCNDNECRGTGFISRELEDRGKVLSSAEAYSPDHSDPENIHFATAGSSPVWNDGYQNNYTLTKPITEKDDPRDLLLKLAYLAGLDPKAVEPTCHYGQDETPLWCTATVGTFELQARYENRGTRVVVAHAEGEEHGSYVIVSGVETCSEGEGCVATFTKTGKRPPRIQEPPRRRYPGLEFIFNR